MFADEAHMFVGSTPPYRQTIFDVFIMVCVSVTYQCIHSHISILGDEIWWHISSHIKSHISSYIAYQIPYPYHFLFFYPISDISSHISISLSLNILNILPWIPPKQNPHVSTSLLLWRHLWVLRTKKTEIRKLSSRPKTCPKRRENRLRNGLMYVNVLYVNVC